MSDIAENGDHPYRLIYFSRIRPETLADMDGAMRDILHASLRFNRRADVTGALLACGGYFLQALEGPRAGVEEIFGRIKRDRRHEEVQVVGAGPMPQRQFANWSMCASQFSVRDAAIVKILAAKKRFDLRSLTEANALSLLKVVSDLHSEAPSSM